MHSFLGQWVANRVTDMLELLYDRIYVCRSGSAADTQTIARYTRYYLDSFKYLALFLEEFAIPVYLEPTLIWNPQ